MIKIDGGETKVVFSEDILFFDSIRAEVTSGGDEPDARIELKYGHKNDFQSDHFVYIRRLTLPEAMLLAETLIAAAEAADGAIKKIKKSASGKAR